MSLIAWQGVALFAFIPAVLFLYLALPLGAGASLLLGLALMFSHRFVASPWMLRHAEHRCLWCGRAGDFGERVEATAGARGLAFAACRPEHAERSRRFLGFVERFRVPIGVGIFVPLVVLLAGAAARAIGRPILPWEWCRLQFRLVVAVTVVATSLGWLAAGAPAGPPRCVFPPHNLFLLGIRNTLWVLRVVGAWWIVAGIAALLRGSL